MSLRESGSFSSACRSTHYLRSLAVRLLLIVSAVVAVGGCSPDTLPTEPREQEADPAAIGSAGSLLTGSTRVIDPDVFELLSRSDSGNAVYQFRVLSEDAPSIDRDNFIVGEDDEGQIFIRRVIEAERDGDDLMLETSVAYWHDVLGAGSTSTEAGQGGPALGPLWTFGGVMDLPQQRVPLDDFDVCVETNALLAALPGDLSICGQEREVISTTIFKLSLEANATINEMVIDEGYFDVSGTLGMEATVDRGGVTGGRRPRFSPCDEKAYTGCLQTPTGAALIDFLRTYAPAIPDGSLAPNRVCIPGTPIRIRSGRWDTSRLIPRWIPPVFELCRIADIGELPTIERPSLQGFRFTSRPNLKGRVVLDIRGDGEIELKIGLPIVGRSGELSLNDWKLKGTLGFFFKADVVMKNGGVRVQVDFDEGLASVTEWTPGPGGGWSRDMEVTTSDIGGSIDPIDLPDDVVVRAGLILEVSAQACAGLLGPCELDEKADTTFSLALGAQAKLEFFRFVEGAWSRTSNDNWRIDTDAAWEYTFEAGLTLPGNFDIEDKLKLTPEPLSVYRTDIADLYGTGQLEVSVNTIGPSPDPDGYEVVVERTDTFPVLIESGVTRLGPAHEWGTPLTAQIGANDLVAVVPEDPGCKVFYSDALLNFVPPLLKNLVILARRTGHSPPKYAISRPCELLIAEHEVRLTGVAENCTVSGGPMQVVALQQRNLAEGRAGTTLVDFEVVCADPPTPLGVLEVEATSSGAGSDPNGFQVTIDDVPWGSIVAGEQRVFSGLNAGDRSVELEDVASNCSVTGDNPIVVAVSAAAPMSVIFDVDCATTPTPQGAIRIISSTTGPSQDADGYELRLDGEILTILGGSDAQDVSGPALGEVGVLHIGDVAENCRISGLSPTTVMLDPVAMTAEVPVDVTCTDSPIVVATGAIEGATLPTPTATLLTADRGGLRLTGPLAAELLRMTGASVQVRGPLTAGSLEVYGYDLIPQPEGETSRLGILVQRGAEYWLFGEAALRITDPPARLVEQIGRLVWVVGREAGGSMSPDAFGIIREGH